MIIGYCRMRDCKQAGSTDPGTVADGHIAAHGGVCQRHGVATKDPSSTALTRVFADSGRFEHETSLCAYAAASSCAFVSVNCNVSNGQSAVSEDSTSPASACPTRGSTVFADRAADN